MGTGLAIGVSGCLGSSGDDEGSDDVSESHLSLSNHAEVAHDVEVEIHDVSNDERLVGDRVTIAPDDDVERFSFTTERDENGNFPRVRAEVRMVGDPENADSETRRFSSTAGDSFAGVIREEGRIELYVDQV